MKFYDYFPSVAFVVLAADKFQLGAMMTRLNHRRKIATFVVASHEDVLRLVTRSPSRTWGGTRDKLCMTSSAWEATFVEEIAHFL